MQKHKVLVIGGAGYIGSHVVRALLKNDFAVTVYDNLSTGQECNLFADAQFIRGDILDFQMLRQTMSEGYDAVVHLAAKKAVGESMDNPQKYALNNLNGSVNIFNAMIETGIKNVVFSSSAAVFGMPQYIPVDEQHPVCPINFYGYTKLKIEELMDWYSRLKDFHYIAVRYFNAVGYAADGSIKGREKNPQNLLPIVMEVATGKRQKMQVFGNDYDTPDGTCVRDYIHVEDLASAHVAAIRQLLQNGDSHVINLGTNKGTSVLEIIEAVERVTGRKIAYEFAPRRVGDPAILVATNQKAQKVLNWQPDYVNIDEIIQTTWNLEVK